MKTKAIKSLLVLALAFSALLFDANGQSDGTYTVSESWSVTVYNPEVSGSPAVFTRSGVQSGTINISGGAYQLINTTGTSVGSLDASIQYDGFSQYTVNARSVLYAFASKGTEFYAVVKLSFFVVLVPLGPEWGFSLFQRDDQYTASGFSLSNLQGSGTAIDGNSAEYDASSIASLTLHIVSPTITTPPIGQTVGAGSAASFSVEASGTPPFTYQWKHGGTILSDSGEFSGTTTPTLNISNAQAKDAGSYMVLVSNSKGSSTAMATLTVVTLPPLTNLYSFTGGSDGAVPVGVILSGATLYGTAVYGGSSSNGTVFAVNTDGTDFTNLYSFTNGDDGASPDSGVIISGNTLYGTASKGGTSSNGTVFAVNTDGTSFTVLHTFTATSRPLLTNSDGATPKAGLILSRNFLYGTTEYGGSSGYGTVFALSTDGTGFTNLYSFTNGNDGAYPFSGLILSGNTLYGTANGGGSSSDGTVFKLNTDGTDFTSLHSFTVLDSATLTTNSDGAYPTGGLMLSGNTLYGTAGLGGSSGNGTVFKVNTDGGGFAALHSFSKTDMIGFNSDGAGADAGLVLSGGTLYGTASFGGSSGGGTVFALSTNGTDFTTLHSFSGASDGYDPGSGLIISGNTLYGTASEGGSSGHGAVFSLLLAPASLRQGSLKVTIGPSGALTAGAEWQVDAGPYQNSAATVTNLPVGEHTVSFKSIPGWITPSNQTVAIAANQTETVSATYLPIIAILTVTTNGVGSLSTSYNGPSLQVGNSYRITATAGPGFAFTNWTGGTNLPLTVLTNGLTVQFVMESNLVLEANFVDIQRPTMTIAAPSPNQRWSNEVFTVQGKIRDNDQVAAVFYRLNTNDWTMASTTNGWTNWTADVMLTPGTNVLHAYAVDAAGNHSPTGSVSFFYVVRTPLAVEINGKGSVNPNYNGQLLEIGRNYTMTAAPSAAAGYAFTNWSGSQTTNKAALTFLMTSNLVFTANFVDIQKPTLTITFPTANQPWSNELFTVQGKAHDNDHVADVLYQLNTNDWAMASTTNGWTNWTADVTVTPGTNTVRAYAVDATGNASPTSNVAFFYVVRTPLAVEISGKGTVNPNYNAQLLEFGRNYTMTAAASAGYAFTNWTGSQMTNKPALTFLMASNLGFTANFVDITRPTVAITAPTLGQRWSNAVFTVTGKAGDNAQVAQVFYQLNTNDWAAGSATNGWTNWAAEVELTPGTNVVRAYAVDGTGNRSLTASVTFFYVVDLPLVVQINGKGTVNPNYNGQLLEIGRNYTMTAVAAAGYAFTNWTGSQMTNKPALTFLMASNLDFTANFLDVVRPTVAITSPTPGQRWSNAVFMVAGKAGDNTGVAQVLYQLNTTDWAAASTTNGWTNWTAAVTLTPGTNTVRAYAQDATGNLSPTNSVSFVNVLSGSSAFTLNSPTLLTIRLQSNQVILTLLGDSSRRYLIQSSTDLFNWTDLTSLAPVAGSAQTIQPISVSGMFYRAITKP